MDNNKLIIISGPTAVGKTSLSIKLARLIGGEIISADSMQVYKGMDIGTAKIKKEEMQGVKHYLIDDLTPFDEFNVAVFKKMAQEAIEIIKQNGHIPIIVGGTAFYIQALLYDIDFADEETSRKEELQLFYEQNGKDALFQRLMDIDPKSCEVIDKNNIKRVIRAIEYYENHNETISEHNLKQMQKESPYNFAYFCLNDERDVLYSKINLRVDKMIEEGLVQEVSKLKEMGLNTNNISMLGIGYKEILSYLDGNCTLDEAVYDIKINTRHFAKKQITWYKREREIDIINKKDYNYDDEMIIKEMMKILQKKGIIND